MPIGQCIGGHFYDCAIYAVCPHCSDIPRFAPDEDCKTVAMFSDEILVQEEVPKRESGGSRDEKTIAIYESRINADPVVGWLVSMVGPEKGRDYRLHSGRNFIGRSLRMDVLLADDAGVSRDNHCSVVYDPMSNAFSIVPGDGTNTYVNGALLTAPIQISDNDTVLLGNTELVFNAFCKGARKWL